MFSNKSIIGAFTVLVLIMASMIFIGADHNKSAEQAVGTMTAKMMIDMDSNGDGKITLDEASAQLKDGFAFLDQNKDDSIDINEVQIMADYANNQTIEQPEVQSLTTNQKIKYETAAIIDQVGTESLFVWVGNMYFSVEMSGSPQKLITDLKQYRQKKQ